MDRALGRGLGLQRDPDLDPEQLHVGGQPLPNVLRYFQKSRVVLSRLSLEIRATLGLPYGERINRVAS